MDQISNDNRIARLESQVKEITTLISRVTRPKRKPRVVIDVKSVMEPIKWLSTSTTVNEAGGGSVSWTTFDATRYVPLETTDVILDVKATNAAGGGELTFNVRRSSNDLELEFASCTSASDTCAGQVICPVVRSYESRTFDYKITSPGGATWKVRVIGYIKSNKVYGSSVTDPRTGVSGSGSGGGGIGGGGGGGISGIIPPVE